MLAGAIPASQALAHRLVAAGFAGMRVQSFSAGASTDDLNLVLWSWSAERPAQVLLIDDEGRLSRARLEPCGISPVSSMLPPQSAAPRLLAGALDIGFSLSDTANPVRRSTQ